MQLCGSGIYTEQFWETQLDLELAKNLVQVMNCELMHPSTFGCCLFSD